MAVPAYDDANFRLEFPAYADTTKYPEATLQMYWTNASLYINKYSTCLWTQDQLQYALDLLAAHIAYIMDKTNGGVTPMVIVTATEGTVTVGGEPPPVSSGFQWWLNTSPYGQQLRALMEIVGSIGLYVGGQFPRAGFRNGWGTFG